MSLKGRDVYPVCREQAQRVEIMTPDKDRSPRENGAKYWACPSVQAQPAGVARRYDLIDRTPGNAKRSERRLEVANNANRC